MRTCHSTLLPAAVCAAVRGDKKDANKCDRPVNLVFKHSSNREGHCGWEVETEYLAIPDASCSHVTC